jgi:hypothetical protein
MANNNHGWGWRCAAASAALLMAFAAIIPAASAQNTNRKVKIDAAKTVDLNTAPDVPAVPWPADLNINRPTMPMADYLAAKNAAAARVGPAVDETGGNTPPATGVTFYTQAPVTNQSQAGGTVPPDGDIATSSQWMVQVVQHRVTMYNWNTNAFRQISLATLFQDSTDVLFDPRVIYDPYWDRFVVLVGACSPCSGSYPSSIFELAVSKTGDPTAAWWLYSPSVIGATDFGDFPQLGMDLNSLIVTTNVFYSLSYYQSAAAFAIAKAYLYNGVAPIINVFENLGCTTAPPYVIDDSDVDYLLQFCPGAAYVSLYSMTNSGMRDANVQFVTNVTVSYAGLPPNAPQPGVNYPLDTGDNRFENRSLQVGNRIVNAATIRISTATAAWYDFDIGASPPVLATEGIWYASSGSYDWHPSITANALAPLFATSSLGEVFGTWMSVDAANNVNIQLRAIGGTGDNAGFGAGIPVFTSAIPLTGQTDSNGIHRSGDYSYIALYPAAALGCTNANEIGILTGETSGPSAGLWGSRIGIVKHC